MPDTELLLPMAEIAGVFVGFGALISIRTAESREPHTVVALSAVLWLGLWVVVAALVPVGIGRFGLEGRALWLPCCLLALVLWWIAFLVSRRAPEFRVDVATSPRAQNMLYVAVAVPLFLVMNVALVLTALGVWPELAPAFYLVAVMICLLMSGFTLITFVFTQGDRRAP
ncbi:hypothetical protein [Agromyces bauzanensis]